MRVLYLSRGYTTHDRRFVETLSRAGHLVGYLRLESEEPALERRSLPAGVRWLDRATSRVRFAAAALSDLVEGVKRVGEDFRPDIIHAGPVQTAALVAARTKLGPLVTMSWGYDLLWDAPKSSESKATTRYVLAKSDALIVDCQAVARSAVSFGMNPARIVSFPWGVDVSFFSPPQDLERSQLRRRLGMDAPRGPTFWVISTRTWETMYGVEILLDGFLKATHDDPSVGLIMIGDGSLASVLANRVAEAGARERVRFPGRMEPRRVRDYFRASDLYLSASRTDGASVSLLEAMGCGIPSVLSNIPGNAEWVASGEQGWLFADGDAVALASTLRDSVAWLRNNPEAAREMGEAARYVVLERADWNRNAPQLFEAYRIAIGSGASSG